MEINLETEASVVVVIGIAEEWTEKEEDVPVTIEISLET